jgi:hypothetical protein
LDPFGRSPPAAALVATAFVFTVTYSGREIQLNIR